MVIKSLREHLMLLYKSLFFSSWKTENWINTKMNLNKKKQQKKYKQSIKDKKINFLL